MKPHVLLIPLLILMVVSGVLIGYQVSYHETLTGLEARLTAAESTILALNQGIELLENADQESQTETDVLEILQGKTYWAYVGNMGYMQIRFGACLNLGE